MEFKYVVVESHLYFHCRKLKMELDLMELNSFEYNLDKKISLGKI